MELDKIRAAFESAQREVPAEALRAAVSRARELAPMVTAACAEAAAGAYLLPRRHGLMFFGLHALAAARETSAWPSLLRLLERSEWELERALNFDYMGTSARLLLSFYDGDADSLYALIERPEIDDGVRAMLFDVLARLVWEGRADRTRFVEFLDRVDREALMPVDDFAWLGWQNAVMFLGLTDFEARVRRGWQAGRMRHKNEAGRKDWAERLARAVATPDDPQLFLDDGIAPIGDPVDALAWMTRMFATLDAEADDPDDPARGVRLTRQEIDWLGGFLLTDKAPGAMSIEQIDGFFTAVLCGPEPATLADCINDIWDGPPTFDSEAQRELVMELLGRHWAALEARLKASFPQVPTIIDDFTELAGAEWARGFVTALETRPAGWEKLFGHRTAAVLTRAIVSLACGREADDRPLSAKARNTILAALPTIPLRIRDFWWAPETFAAPLRAAKIGRNDPCPCGSGRKYKKCCGGGRAPAA